MTLLDCAKLNGDLSIGLKCIQGLLFTEALLAPTEDEQAYWKKWHHPAVHLVAVI